MVYDRVVSSRSLASGRIHLVFIRYRGIFILIVPYNIHHAVYPVYPCGEKKKAKPLNGTIPVVAHMNLIIAVIFELWLVFDFVMRGSAGIREWTAGFAVLLIAGWFTCNILGYLARIVPFLWWAYRFHHGWQKKSKILLKDMVKETRMGIELWIYAAAIGWVAGSIAFAWPPGSVIGLAAALVMAVVYLYELSRAFRY